MKEFSLEEQIQIHNSQELNKKIDIMFENPRKKILKYTDIEFHLYASRDTENEFNFFNARESCWYTIKNLNEFISLIENLILQKTLTNKF
jgi:hypothetical protein